ncbi:MAG: NAD-dependent epimerase/dehydratase family protein [Luteitalea sp.]|nr:NAD-dependent epimerase/dehydratase family protein [Luteitalea sp.]
MIGAATRGERTVLVTGAAGFIGSALCSRLVSRGDRVIGYDNLSRGRRAHLPGAVHLVEGDIRDRRRLRETISGTRPDCVIHLAAMHFIPDCMARPRETLDVNVEATGGLLESLVGSSVQCFIFASTAAVYAPSDHPCVEETTRLHPLEIYGESKLAAEQLVTAFHAQCGIATSILRLFNAVGRRETNPHVIPHILESLQTSTTIELGNMAPRRDYIDTRDVADATLAVWEAAGGLQVLNVGTGAAYSVSDVVESLGRILGHPIAVVQEPSRTRASERMLLVADIGKIRRVTGWRPRIGLEEALRDLVLAYRLQAEPHIAD